MAQETGTKADYAKHRDCSKAYLSKKSVAERLEPLLFIDPADGKQKLNFAEADKVLAESGDPARETAPTDLQKSDAEEKKASGFHAVKTEREQVKLQSERMDLEQRLGNTLDRQQVEDACVWAGTKIREHLGNRNRRIAEKLATMTDVLKIRALLDEDDRAMLQGLQDEFIRRISDNQQSAGQLH